MQLNVQFVWDTAKEWLTEKSKFKGELETNTKNLL
jgi:hypothetical protein